MKVNELRKMAKALGVTKMETKKAGLIKQIQRAEGNPDCFGTAVGGFCDQDACIFREDCLPKTKAA